MQGNTEIVSVLAAVWRANGLPLTLQHLVQAVADPCHDAHAETYAAVMVEVLSEGRLRLVRLVQLRVNPGSITQLRVGCTYPNVETWSIDMLRSYGY